MIEKAAINFYDLIIIGGGITGAGIALDAASRGMKTLLLEMNDFASGTSSRSTKLIHGGLRYLKQLDVKLVKEVGRERAILHKNAPHIVIPEKMLLPIVKKGSLGWFTTSIGLKIYDWLAEVKNNEKREMLSAEKTARAEPLLNKKILNGGGLYTEYRTDDARLVIEIIKSACACGANCLNYVKVNRFIYKDNKLTAVDATDCLTNGTYVFSATKIINAAGPWVDKLRKLDSSLKGKKLHLTKGVHIVVDYEKLPLRQSVYFDVKDGRMIFAIPRGDKTYIGTTDTTFDNDIGRPFTSKEDVDYLLEAVHDMFPSTHISMDDISSSWAGLRPLIHEEGKGPSELSRKDEIFVSGSGLISIAGGKLTGYRKMAERVVDLVADKLKEEEKQNFGKTVTDKIQLSGGDIPKSLNLREYTKRKQEETGQIGLAFQQLDILVRRYGTNVEHIIKRVYQTKSETSDLELLLLKAEVWYCVQYEMALHLSDFLVRRTGMLYFDRERAWVVHEIVASYMAGLLSWNEEELEMEKSAFAELYKEAVSFKEDNMSNG